MRDENVPGEEDAETGESGLFEEVEDEEGFGGKTE